MNWTNLLSLKRFGDTEGRPRLLQDESRLGYEVDYDRIIFSDMFRSLQDKTQVVPLSEVDFVHTRLTHSLEVSVVGRSLGRIVGEEILHRHQDLRQDGHKINDFGAIVAAAGLAHDIGNPPFGHSGENAIGDYFKHGNGKQFESQLNETQWQDLVKFEGNANGFRLLTETRPGIEGGLRLSYATLGAFIKYPKLSLPNQKTNHIAAKKFGVFYKDLDFFKELTQELGLKPIKANKLSFHRHPLTYLVEAADDICYSIIDFEDAINLGLIKEERALEFLISLVRPNLITDKYSKLSTKKDRVSYLRALAIQALIYEAADVFLKHETEIMNGNFPYALLEKSRFESQLKGIIDVSVDKLYQSKNVIDKELKGHHVISGLLDRFISATNNVYGDKATRYDKLVYKLLPEEYQRLYDSLYERVLSCCSFIAGMSDGYAIQLYGKLS